MVLNGLIVTTYKEYALKSFRVRANKNLNNPHLLSELDPIVKGKNVVSIKVKFSPSYLQVENTCLPFRLGYLSISHARFLLEI